MKKNSQIIFVLGLAAALSACSVESKVDGGTLPLPPGPFAPSVGVDGTWKSNCVADQGNHQIETMHFEGGVFTNEVEVFNNSTCSGDAMFTATVDGTYVVKGTSAVAGGLDVDVTISDGGGLYMLVAVIEGIQMYLPSSAHDSSVSRATSVDRNKPYTKVGALQ